ncbi:ATP-dependent Clp protease ATP-binding subunit ClpX [candidate division WOR-3 bacterium]|uniref:ATP-dependent Clp protease ATP-binding subunit ClpX n=1 Tax=candidate division WOR-3 bacterium TaxID=2052148 RepID=A0A937XH75_UNCW3|nr:ATP-dependent Clp protease ATP-binding subunit ClpX [candidate division WOR-3 bacterium]
MTEGPRRRTSRSRCSFCGLEAGPGLKLVQGRTGRICERCAATVSGLFREQRNAPPIQPPAKVPKPAEIKSFLDEYVIGQEHAKKVISVAVYNHYQRVFSTRRDVEVEKSNILLFGPTGVGKTLIAETLARFLHVPFSISDATPLTEAGYVGEDVENILLRLIQAAGGDVRRAETGIIYLDEIDKLGRKADSASITRDVSGEGVQQALLKILEGTIASVPPQGGRKHPEQQYTPVDTRHILFICGGMFDGLERIVERRIRSNTLGFGADISERRLRTSDELLPLVEPDDLIKYGLIPELVGRLPVVAGLHSLSREALVDILTKPRNALTRQFAFCFELEGVKLTFTPEALGAVAELAAARKIGARALRSVLEETMLNIMFELPSRTDVEECIITDGTVRAKQPPEYVLRQLHRKAQ